jgi:ribonuclease HII
MPPKQKVTFAAAAAAPAPAPAPAPAQALVVGVDECGRGCLYGDVVAGAVVLKPRESLASDEDRAAYDALTDSKVLSAKRREALAEAIRTRLAVTYGIGRVSPRVIEDVNILQATMRAMHLALDAAAASLPAGAAPPLTAAASFAKIQVDGTYFKPWRAGGSGEIVPYECIVKGDLKEKAISAASIIAKQARDGDIVAETLADPSLRLYGLHTNMGYGTAQHMRALRELGPRANHRMTFAPIPDILAAAAAAAAAAPTGDGSASP